MRIKEYLSYSQFDIFRKSPELYEKVYIKGIKQQSKFLDFGKKIAEALEKGEGADPEETLAISLLPPAEEHEVEIRTKLDDVPLMGVLDGFTRAPVIIDEYKTGTVKWDQRRVDDAEQLTFYAILASRFLNVPMEKILIRLHWMPTYVDTDGTIHLTGEVKSFTTKRTTKHLINIYPQIQEVWTGIEKLIDEICQ